MAYKMSVRQSRKLIGILKSLDLKEILAPVDLSGSDISKEDLEAIKDGSLENIDTDQYAGKTVQILSAFVETILNQSDEILDKFNDFIADITKQEIETIEDTEFEAYLELILKVFTDINFSRIFKKYGSLITPKLKQLFTPKSVT